MSGKLAKQVVDALKQLHITSASPALYLELARYYEHRREFTPVLSEAVSAAEPDLREKISGGSKVLLSSADAQKLMPENLQKFVQNKIISLDPVSRLYPNFRLSLDLAALADLLELKSPVTELEIAPSLYTAGEACGVWLMLLCEHLQVELLPLYLVLKKPDDFSLRYLGTPYPEGRPALLDTAQLFRNALGYPVKKVRCRAKGIDLGAN